MSRSPSHNFLSHITRASLKSPTHTSLSPHTRLSLSRILLSLTNFILFHELTLPTHITRESNITNTHFTLPTHERSSQWNWCEKCLLIMKSPDAPCHYRYLILGPLNHLDILNRPEFAPRLNHFDDPEYPKEAWIISKKRLLQNKRTTNMAVFGSVRGKVLFNHQMLR